MAYLGFFVCIENEFAALANCNLNYSTWQTKFLINIHDFIVLPKFRDQGVGEFLLRELEAYAKEKGYCKLNLEVRNDNLKVQNLYKKVGYSDSQPPMFFFGRKSFEYEGCISKGIVSKLVLRLEYQVSILKPQAGQRIH